MTTLYVDNIAPNLQSTISAPNIKLPTGSVIQVVTARSEGGAISSTSTGFVNSGIGISITPKFATSKILVETSFTSTSSSGNSANAGTTFKFFKSIAGGAYSSIRSGNGFLEYSSDSGNYNHSVAHMMEEISPNTTGVVAFRIYYRTLSGFVGGIQRDWGGVNVRAMEIAG
tara:strand:- start:782 stop:1294 length:513 start_codon:yes stop_codon:yes gene_type:complete